MKKEEEKMTLEEFKEKIKSGDVFQVLHRPTITIRIIELVKDNIFEPEDVTHVVFAYTLKNRVPEVLPIEKFFSYVDKGMLIHVTQHKYSPGQAFYSINGNIYVIQCRSNIFHPGIGHRYFVTVVETIGQEDCEVDKWGVKLNKRYKLSEAILDEEVLDALEPFETFEVDYELDLNDMEKEFESIKPLEDVTHKGKVYKRGYTR